MAAETTEQFDPYYKWLGIPRDEQPPHHYRLLGITAFENDLNVIENAADRQMSHVRTFQGGKHAKESQKILNQLATAKVCLLQSEKKSAYDQSLRKQMIPAAAPLPVPPSASTLLPVPFEPSPTAPAPVAPPDPHFAHSPQISRSKAVAHRRRKKSNLLPIAITVLCLAVLVVGGVILAKQLGDKNNEASDVGEDATRRASDSPEPTSPPTPPTPEKIAVVRTPAVKPEPEKPPSPSPMPIVVPDDPAPNRKAELRDALMQLRVALSNRDPEAARTHLRKADELKQTADESAAVEAMRKQLMALLANTSPSLPEIPDPSLLPQPDRPESTEVAIAPLPVPTAEALIDARATVRKEFSLTGARTGEQKSLLITELRNRADDESDMALKYAMLDQAKTLAVNAELIDPALAIVDSLAEQFEMDGLREKQILLTKMSSSSQVRQIFDMSTELYEQAVAETRYDVAQLLGDSRKRAAMRLRDADLLDQVNADLKNLMELKRAP